MADKATEEGQEIGGVVQVLDIETGSLADAAGTAAGAERAQEATEAGVPQFTLRADHRGHLAALMAALELLPEAEAADGRLALREFEFWEEKHRRTAVS